MTFFLLKKKGNSYIKDRFPVECLVDRDTEYSHLVSAGCDALECPLPPCGHTNALFTSGGAKIKEGRDWLLSVYMQQQHGPW